MASPARLRIEGRRGVGAAAAALLLVACAHRAPPFIPPAAFTRPDSLGPVMAAVLARTGTPGAAIGVVRGGSVAWSRGFGYADLARRIPVTESTVFQVASISKSVTAWGVLRLVDEHRVALDAPVNGMLSRWHLPRSAFDPAEVTVRRVLSHTAGLSNNAYQGYRPDTTLPSLEETLSGRNDGVGDVRIVRAPGTGWGYSEGGFTLLQLLVEEVTGMTFAAYMRRAVLEPLGMGSSSFVWDSALRSRTATAYDDRQRPLPNYLFAEQAADGLYTTAPDLARFVGAFMSDGGGGRPGRGVLSPATVALAAAPAEASRGTWGLGVNVGSLSDGTRWIAHAGTNRGWRAHMMGYPERGAGIVVLTNGDNGEAVADATVCAWQSYELHLAPERCR